MFNHVTNCNVGYDSRDDKLSQKETAELLTFATTLANAVIIDTELLLGEIFLVIE